MEICRQSGDLVQIRTGIEIIRQFILSKDTSEALKAWRQEVMLGHEVELDQLKTEKEAEISALLQEKNKNDSDVVDWKEKYEALLRQSEIDKAQQQEELQQKYRLEIEGLRSRFA